MKLRFAHLSLAAACGLPAFSLAQGTYLSAPGGTPTNAVVVGVGGFVGIGTPPWSGARVTIDVGDNDGIAFLSASQHHWRMGPQTGSGSGFGIHDDTLGFMALKISTNRTIGIGTAHPGATLDVAGDIRCTVIDLTSDRNAKTAFAPVDCGDILERVTRLILTTWQYTNAPGVKHVGPMAQDFHAAFALGADDRHISTVDADGVALAAIQGLNSKLESDLKRRDALIAALEEKLTLLAGQFADFATASAPCASASPTPRSNAPGTIE